MKPKAIYRKRDEWVLGYCVRCGGTNYVEPHGVTTYCPKCKVDTAHIPIPYECRDLSGTVMIRPYNHRDIKQVQA